MVEYDNRCKLYEAIRILHRILLTTDVQASKYYL